MESVLQELARVVRSGGRFVFCVPNHRFPELLLGKTALNRVGAMSAGSWYSRFFNRISRHQHCDSYDVWNKRLNEAGFAIEKHWDYFDAQALHKMEMGHAFGLPALASKMVFKRWILIDQKWNLFLPYLISRKVFQQPYSDEGVYSFYIAKRM